MQGEVPALRLHGAGPGHDVDEQVDHHRGGDEIEHDGRDDDVAAPVGLQPRGHEGPGGAEESGPGDGRGHDQGKGQEIQVQAHQGCPQSADVGLALAPDIEQAAVKGHRHRQPGKDEVGGVEEGIADRLLEAEGAPYQYPYHLPRVLADQQHDQAGDGEGGQQVERRQQPQDRPTGQTGRRSRGHGAHGARRASFKATSRLSAGNSPRTAQRGNAAAGPMAATLTARGGPRSSRRRRPSAGPAPAPSPARPGPHRRWSRRT